MLTREQIVAIRNEVEADGADYINDNLTTFEVREARALCDAALSAMDERDGLKSACAVYQKEAAEARAEVERKDAALREIVAWFTEPGEMHDNCFEMARAALAASGAKGGGENEAASGRPSGPRLPDAAKSGRHFGSRSGLPDAGSRHAADAAQAATPPSHAPDHAEIKRLRDEAQQASSLAGEAMERAGAVADRLNEMLGAEPPSRERLLELAMECVSLGRWEAGKPFHQRAPNETIAARALAAWEAEAPSREWLARAAIREDGCEVSVGGLASQLGMLKSDHLAGCRCPECDPDWNDPRQNRDEDGEAPSREAER